LKEYNKSFELYYNVRPVENVTDYSHNMVLKGSISDAGSNNAEFVKTCYEIKPAYCVARDK